MAGTAAGRRQFVLKNQDGHIEERFVRLQARTAPILAAEIPGGIRTRSLIA